MYMCKNHLEPHSKGFQNHSHKKTNVLQVTLDFYGMYKYKSPSERQKGILRREKFLARFQPPIALVPVAMVSATVSCSLASPA